MYKPVFLVAALAAFAYGAPLQCATDWDAISAAIVDSKQNLALPIQDGLTHLCGADAGCDSASFCEKLTATATQLDAILGDLHAQAFQHTLTQEHATQAAKNYIQIASSFYADVHRHRGVLSSTIVTYNQNLYSKFLYTFQNNAKVLAALAPKSCGPNWDAIVAAVLEAKQVIVLPINDGLTNLCADKSGCSVTATFCDGLVATAQKLDEILADLRRKAVEQTLTEKYVTYWVSEYAKIAGGFIQNAATQRDVLPAVVGTYSTNLLAVFTNSLKILQDRVVAELAPQ